MKGECLTIGLVLILICVNASGSFVKDIEIKDRSSTRFEGNTLYVGGNGLNNYTKIQDAIDNSSDGDTVFVYVASSPYYENVVLDKGIDLVGEDKYATIIDAGETGSVVSITADRVNVTGFTIQKGGIYPYPDEVYAGIDIHSNYTFISNNIITSNNDRGINIRSSSSNNILSYNTISLNGGSSVSMDNSIDTIIFGNVITNNGDDVYLSSSNNNFIFENIFENDGIHIFSSYQNTIINNIVNGKPLIYLEEESNIIIGEAGQIILVKCNNITIRNQEISNVGIAIHLIETDTCHISDNIITNNKNGINLDSSDTNIISGNILNGNEFNGIDLSSSNNNTVLENTIHSNNEYGIDIHSSNDNTILSNNIASSKRHGICIVLSNDNTIAGNIIDSNTEYGIVLYEGSNIISDNSFLNDGLFISSIDHNIVTNNSVNGKPLVYLENESDIVIDGNAGQVILVSCSNILVKNQNISNTDNGITLLDCNGCFVQNNILDSNNGCGIFLFLLCNGNNISDNSLLSNKGDGICIRSSYNKKSIGNTIYRNVIDSNNQYGIYLDGSSDDTTILANTILSNNAQGIYVRVSVNNFISENHIEDNVGGILLVGSVDNVISYNNFINNKINAFFTDAFSLDPPFLFGKSKWLGNYWDRPRFLPKPIFGIMAMIPWFNVDWRPAGKLYDIFLI